MFCDFSSNKTITKEKALEKTPENLEFRVCVGEFLRELRIRDMGIKNQTTLAKRIGLSQPSISKYESGESHVPLLAVYKYFDAAGIDHQEGIARLDELLNERKK